MNNIYLSASLVVYKPDFLILDRTLDALQQGFVFARDKYALHFELTLVDNSDDKEWTTHTESWLAKRDLPPDGMKISLLNAKSNLGYGHGNNLVIDTVKSDYHLVINPDLFIEPDTLAQALCFMEANPDVGLLTPAIFGEDGVRHHMCKRNPTLFVMFLRNLRFSWIQSLFKSTLAQFEMRECNYDDIIDGVEYASGCFMFFRTRLLQQINGFDTAYFLHFEDADISRRMLKIAHIVYVPNVKVKHRWERETYRNLKMRLVTIRSGLFYWNKWGGTFSITSAKNAVEKPTTLNRNYVGLTDSCKKVLITGANGFIGKSLCTNLALAGCHVCGAIRQSTTDVSNDVEYVAIGNIDEHTDWSATLADVDALVHLAARVHVMDESTNDSLTEFRRINVLATMNLARQAVSAGVKRFVFISSIKVNGESTNPGHPYTADDAPAPIDPYGVSKREAEQALRELSKETGLEVVIIRPVLVYGPGVKGNILAMMKWLHRGIPLPLGAVHNRRSLVALDNLVDLITICLYHKKAAGQILLVSDEEDISTTGLLQQLIAALGSFTLLIPVPEQILPTVLQLLGKKGYRQRLSGFLQVDNSRTRELLDWNPPIRTSDALKKTAQHFLANQ